MKAKVVFFCLFFLYFIKYNILIIGLFTQKTLNKRLTNYGWHRHWHRVYENGNTNKQRKKETKKQTNRWISSPCWDTQLTHQETNMNVPLQLLAALLGATAMATWHAALFMEMEKIHEPGFPLTWPDWLQVQCKLLISYTTIMDQSHVTRPH